MAPQYDNLGTSYQQMEQSPVRIYAEGVSFFRILGSLEGCTVLDVACGTGYYTRQLKQRGAKSVLGVDVSPGMINLAKEAEFHQKDGVEYQVYDAVELPHLASFDVVTAIYLLVYAESKAQLLTMCQNLYRNLASPGRLVTVVANPGPLLPRARSFKYGGTNHRPATVKEGDRYELELHVDPPISAFCVHWSQETFEWALTEAGFGNITWTNPSVSPEGLQKFGTAYWEDFLERPHMAFISATK